MLYIMKNKQKRPLSNIIAATGACPNDRPSGKIGVSEKAGKED